VRYQGNGRPDDTELCRRLRALAQERPRFGYRRLHALLRRDGEIVNHKRVYRLYRAEGLAVPRRKRKRVARGRGRPLPIAILPNVTWSLDFMSDATASGRVIRTLSVLDHCTREALAIAVDTSLPGTRVVQVLDRLRDMHRTPTTIVLDNGPELTSRALDQWATQHGVTLHFIDAGKPEQNALMESFHGRFRDECLNSHWFTSLSDARRIIEDWRQDYNQVRPHSSLKYATPHEVYEQLVGTTATENAVGFS
jgi:putative transposase